MNTNKFLGINLIIAALFAAAITEARAQNFNWDGDNAAGNFLYSDNWYNNTIPSFSYSGSLIFNYRNNASQTSQYYDFGGWANANDIIWESTWGTATTFNGNGQGINFKQRIENRSSHAVTIGSMNLSGGKDGVSQIELNPVNGDLTLSGNLYNDNNLSYKTYGGNSKLLTINTSLGGNNNVGYSIEQYSKVYITAAQGIGGSSAFDIKTGELWIGTGGSLTNGMRINLGLNDSGTAKFYLTGTANDSHTVNVQNNGGTKVMGGLSSSGTNTFSGAITNNGGLTLENTAAGGTVAFSGAISGNGAVTIGSGNAGTVQLINANTFAGGVTVNGGTLQISNNAALGTNAVTLNSGTFASASSTAYTVTNTVNIGGNVTFGQSSIGTGSLTISNVNLQQATRSITVANTNLNIVGVISNGGGTAAGITKAGNGTMTMSGSGANTFSGASTVSAGTLILNKSANTAAIAGALTISSGASLRTDAANQLNNQLVTVNGAYDMNSQGQSFALAGSGTVTMNAALTNNNNGSDTFSGKLTSSGALVKAGNGTLILSGTANDYTGTTTVDGGAVRISHANALGTTAGSTTINSGGALEVSGGVTTGAEALSLNGTGVSSGGALRNISGDNNYAGAITLAGASRINSDSGTLTVSGGVSGAQNLTIGGSGHTTVSSAIATSTGNLVKDGTGTATLTGANSYSGTTLISGGTLQLGSGGASGSIGAGNITNNATLLVNRTGDVSMGNTISGTGALNKAAAGTLTLSANNSYSGETVIDGGTLALTGSGAIASSSIVKVGTNATFDISGVTTSATVKAVAEQGSGDGGEVKLGSKGLVMSGADSGTYFLRALGVAGDTGTFTLNDSDSTLSLYGASQYTGATTLTAGTLTTSAAMSSASYALSGGNLSTSAGANLSDTAAVSVTSGTFTVGANDTIGSIAGAGGIINITNSGTLTLGANTTSTFSGAIAGNGALVKGGTGTLTFDGSSANTYSGTTTVNAGTLVLGKTGGANALAGTPTINNGGTIKLAAGNQFSGDTTFLTVNSGGVFDMNSFNETLAIQGTNGTVKLGSGTITINPTGSDSFAGTIEGTGAVIKTNSGTQVLAGDSTYTGATTVGQGVLRVAHNNALGTTAGTTTVNSGAALQLSNGITLAEAITLNGTGVDGLDGALRNVSGDNTVNGNISMGSNVRIGATGGSLTVGGDVSGGNNVLFVGGSGNSAVNGAISGAGNTQNGTTTSLFKDGSGTLTLSGTNSYTGDTRVAEGRLTVASGGNLGNGTSDVFVSSGATLDVDTSVTIASLSEAGNADGGTADIASGATLTVNQSAGTKYFGAITGSGRLTKSGAGTLSLYGTSTKTGTNTVSGGALEIQSGASLVGKTTVGSGAALVVNGTLDAGFGNEINVNSGATLSGSGSVGYTIVNSGATISPGNSPGTLTLTNGLVWNANGNYNWQIYDASGTAGASNGWDLVAVSGGTWDISGLGSSFPFQINLWSLSGIAPDANGSAINFDNTQNYTWEILTYTSINGTFNTNLFAINTGANNGTSGFANDLNGGVFSLAVDGDSLNLLFTAAGGPAPSPVPEPGTWAAAALLAGAAGYVRWRRRKQGEPKA